MAKILVADDNSNIQKMVGLALKDQGIDVVAVGNGEAAVRKISDIHPDLVLADVFMPVRNGYEVCKYVKDDAALAHIPVILLVGAFDPLDEQEAQRVGADGVLKKPFVPPDPLISMVKSALTRAGVPLGPPAHAEKVPPPPPKRSTADILSGGVSSKLAALSPEKPPEITPEPLEELPVPTPHLKIAAGSEPLAFGSLLETPELDDLAVTAKPMVNLSEARKWDEESDEVEEEPQEEEESLSGGWHPDGLGEAAGHVAESSHAAPDWREQAFHGNSPSKTFSSAHWAPSIEAPESVAAAESRSVAVATVESKPVESSVPFSGDAWAAAMAAGVEEKIAEIQDVAPAVAEVATVREIREESVSHVSEGAAFVQDTAAVEAAPVVETPRSEPASEPANWAAVPETAWEVEAKKASLLASTWDAPKPFSIDETQEVPAYSTEAVVEHAEAPPETPVESSSYSPEPVVSGHEEPQVEATASEPVVEVEHVPEQTNVSSEPVEEETPAASEPAVAVVTAQMTEPDMNELVARVLGKMNPEVLQKVTREILRPVIEAIIRDEIDSKKS